eukprot:8097802-Ditylum_brightwellii.AAC.1
MGHESLAIVPSPSSSRLTQFALDLRSEEQKSEEDESKLASTSVDSTTVPDAYSRYLLCADGRAQPVHSKTK